MFYAFIIVNFPFPTKCAEFSDKQQQQKKKKNLVTFAEGKLRINSIIDYIHTRFICIN